MITSTHYFEPNVFSPEECAAILELANQHGFDEAPINNGRRFVRMESVRNNTRAMWTDFELADKIWTRLKHIFPERMGGGSPIGVNEMCRCYRYLPGQYFKPHRDAGYFRNTNEWSSHTILLYLNEGYVGGQTRLPDFVAEGGQGSVLIFHHNLIHESSDLISGEKYVLRTDLMLRRVLKEE